MPQVRPMPPNTQFTAYGNSSFIFNGGEGRFSSEAAAGGAGGGLGIATGAEGATTREERGSSEEGGAPADIGRGGRSTCGLAGIDRGSRRIEIAKRARGAVAGDRDQAAGIVNLWGLLWEVGGGDADALQGFIAREDRVVMRRVWIYSSHNPFRGVQICPYPSSDRYRIHIRILKSHIYDVDT